MKIYEKTDGTLIAPENNDIVSKQTLAEMLQVSISTIQRYMRQGMPYTRFQNFCGYSPNDVKAWLKAHNLTNQDIVARLKKEQKARSKKKKAGK